MSFPCKTIPLEKAAQQLGCDVKFLRNAATSGEVLFSMNGDRMMFDPADLDDWYSNLLLRDPARNKTAPQEVRLVELCPAEAVDAHLEGKTKAAVLKNLAALCEKTGLLYDAAEFLEELRKREDVASTAMKEGVALVHTQNHDEFLCEREFIAVARTDSPVFFGNPDGVPTDVFFVIAAQDSNTHISILAQLCRAIVSTPLLQNIRNADTPEEIIHALENV